MEKSLPDISQIFVQLDCAWQKVYQDKEFQNLPKTAKMNQKSESNFKKILNKSNIKISSILNWRLPRRQFFLSLSALDLLAILLIIINGIQPAQTMISPLIHKNEALKPIEGGKSTTEVFGFAPFWTINKLGNVDFETLTTLAYFGVPVLPSGDLDREDYGYQVFKGETATKLFKKAHDNGTRVLLTVTQMKNENILGLLDDDAAQDKAVEQITQEVKLRGIDGINIDIEYDGNPGSEYRNKFSKFVANLSDKMHQEIPGSYVTISVYAVSAKAPKLYDIASISKSTDAVFMMAYDFAVRGSDQAIPTAPLYGHKEGKYWYDISTAVDDFLTKMPSEKLILGVPWYGYNYLVYEPGVKAETRPSYTWRGKPAVQTYAAALEHVNPGMEGITEFKEGWDDHGMVGYKAYHIEETDTWRMIFLEDERSLGVKYDFAKSKNLAGVGMWALGFDDGKTEMWSLLREKIGSKLANSGKLIGQR